MGKSAKATRGGNKLRKNPIRDATKTTSDSLKVTAKKQQERLQNVAKKEMGNATVKGAIPESKKSRITVSKKKKCVIR